VMSESDTRGEHSRGPSKLMVKGDGRGTIGSRRKSADTEILLVTRFQNISPFASSLRPLAMPGCVWGLDWRVAIAIPSAAELSMNEDGV
jgi:hypothetical protein